MYSRQTEDDRESIVIPLFEIVVYPKSRTKFMADKITGEMLLTEMKNAELYICYRVDSEERY